MEERYNLRNYKTNEEREKKLIEMLVNTDFPVKKRSKTSAEILELDKEYFVEETETDVLNTTCSNDIERTSQEARTRDRNQGENMHAPPSEDKTGERTKATLNQLFKELDQKGELSLRSMENSLPGRKSHRKSATNDSPKIHTISEESSGSTSRVFRSPAMKVPSMDPRLLMTHSVLVGDLSSARNFKIFGNNGENVVEDVLFRIGWERLDQTRPSDLCPHLGSPHCRKLSSETAPVHLTWADSPARLRNAVFVDGVEMVNHVPNTALLSDKIKLYESLASYERQVMGGGMRRPGLGIAGHIKMEKFVPTTFRVDVATDRTRFYREFRPGQIWICKPANENCGRGIFLVRSLEEFHQLISLYEELKDKSHRPSSSPKTVKASAQSPSATPRPSPTLNSPSAPQNQTLKTQPAFHNHTFHRVVQKYISAPLLVEGRKADLRAYLLIASTDPYVVLFRRGYVRLAIDPYSADDKSPFSHLTNQFVQKKHPEYEAKKDDSVWTMERFNDFVNTTVGPQVGVATDWVKETLPKEMKKIMVQCFQSIRSNMPSATTNGRFEILGFDFMLDEKLNLWLIEVNVNPSLATNNQTLASVIPSVVQEALYIAIECFEKQKVIRGPLSPLHTRKNFEFIYEEYSSSKWIFGQNPSPRWVPAFVASEEEKARYSVKRRQALFPRLPLGVAPRGKWAAPHEENGAEAICSIAATRHLIESMREAMEAMEKERKEEEGGVGEEEKEGDATKENAEEGSGEKTDDEEEEKEEEWCRERWR